MITVFRPDDSPRKKRLQGVDRKNNILESQKRKGSSELQLWMILETSRIERSWQLTRNE